MPHTPRERVNRVTWWKAIARSTLAPNVRLVAYYLSTRMSPDGSSCFPGQDTIAEACGWTDARNVRRALGALEDAGYIEVRRWGGRPTKGRAQRTHAYLPTVPGDDDQPDEDVRLEPDDQPDTGVRVNDDQPDGTVREEPHDQPDISARPTGHHRSTNRTRMSYEGSREGSSSENPPAPLRSATFPPPPDEPDIVGGERDRDDDLDRQVRNLARRLELDLRKRLPDDLTASLARCLDRGWTVPLLFKRIDGEKPDGQIRYPAGWLTDQLAARSREESPRRAREKREQAIAERERQRADHDRRVAASAERLAADRELLDALDDHDRQELEAKARDEFPNPALVPTRALIAEMARLHRGEPADAR